MAKLERLNVGQIVYSVGSYQSSGANIRHKAHWPVLIKEIDLAGNKVLASWNYNPPRWCYRREVEKWRLSEPGSRNKR